MLPIQKRQRKARCQHQVCQHQAQLTAIAYKRRRE